MSFNFTVVKKNHILAGAVTLMIVTAGYLNYKYDPNKAYDVEVTGRIEDNLGDAVYVDANGITQKFNDLNNSNYTYTNNGDESIFNNTSTLNNGDESIFNNTSELNNGDESVFNNTSALNSGNNMLANNENKSGEGLITDAVAVFNDIENKEEKVFKDIDDYFIATRIDRTNNYAELIESYENILESANTSDKQKNKAEENIEKINNTRNSIMIAENLIKLKGFEDVVILVAENSVNVVVNSNDLSAQEVAQVQSVVMNEFSVDISDIHIMNYE